MIKTDRRPPVRPILWAAAGAAGALLSGPTQAAFYFLPGDLVVSRSVYTGTASTVTVGQTLPGGGTAVANGTYPGVFANAAVDGSFGVTSPIFLDEITTQGAPVQSLAIDPTQLVTSFPSKSELAINRSTNGQALTFMAYSTTPNQLDVSNSNTPGVIEPGNPVTTTPTPRTVGQVSTTGQLTTTPTNAYSGNNGRAAILAGGQYYLVGNAGNGNGSPQIAATTGVQIATPGVGTVASPQNTLQGGSFNITQLGYAADKSAKDNNYRGETIFNNTLYVTKGSGGNGINTVYQVGTAGSLPTPTSATGTITILPGFPTTLANSKTLPVSHPFGLFFANASTLYVADEGAGTASTAATDPMAGLEKWSLVNGVWQLDYVLQNGLNLGTQYTVPGLPTSYDPATDGLRNITGILNPDGSATIFAITSTVSGSGDQGADPNKLVAITDTIGNLTATQAAGESFTTLQSAGFGEVLRGVALTPVPEPASLALLGGAVAALAASRRRRAG